MQRYFLDKNKQFEKDDIHHILKVMRYKDGQKLEVCYQGEVFLAQLKVADGLVSYDIDEKIASFEQLSIDIFQGLPKGNKADEICKTATIFGARSLYFVPMQRSIAKIANLEVKISRFKKIIKEAAELAKRSTLMEVDFINDLTSPILGNYDYVLLADEAEKNTTIMSVIKDVKLKIAIIIGPEGGIDAKEREKLISFGAIPVTLGKLIIPTELAHIAALVSIYSLAK